MSCPVLDLAQQLILRPSLSPDDAGCQEIMIARLEAIGFHIEPMHFGDTLNFWATRGEGKTLAFAGHTDVVPTGDNKLWVTGPFEPTLRDGMLYGRGAADMKGTIVAALAAIRAAQRHGLALKFNPVLLLCTDEEGGLYPGVRYLAEQKLFSGHMLSFNGGAVPRIWGGCFGSIDLKICITGRSAHSGDPVGGINAIEESLPLMNALHTLKRDVEQRASAMPAPLISKDVRSHHVSRWLPRKGGAKVQPCPHALNCWLTAAIRRKSRSKPSLKNSRIVSGRP